MSEHAKNRLPGPQGHGTTQHIHQKNRGPLGQAHHPRSGHGRSTPGPTGHNEGHAPNHNKKAPRFPLNIDGSISGSVPIATPWLLGEIEGKLSLSVEHEANRRKVEVNFKAHKATYEQEVGHILGHVAKVSAEIGPKELKHAFGEAIKHRSAKPVLNALAPKIGIEKAVKHMGPLKQVGLAFQLSPTPIKASYEFDFPELYQFGSTIPLNGLLLVNDPLATALVKVTAKQLKQLSHKLDSEVQWKLELEFGLGPGPEMWAWLAEYVGEPALELLIEATPLALLAAAIASPFLALHGLFQAEKEGKMEGNCWNYAGAYAGTVFGGKLGVADWADEQSKKVIQNYRDLGVSHAIHDAHKSSAKLLKGASVKDDVALKMFATSFKANRKISDNSQARLKMFDEVFAEFTKKMGVTNKDLKDFPPSWQ